MPRDQKRASELSESALAEMDAQPDEGDERLQIEATKPSKMVLGESLRTGCHRSVMIRRLPMCRPFLG